MSLFRVQYHFGMDTYVSSIIVKAKDEKEARIKAHIELDNEDNYDLHFDKIYPIKDVYKENGYKDRKDYFTHLAEEYGLSIFDVAQMSEVLGQQEDFDGLVTMCMDAAALRYEEGEDYDV